MLPATLAIILGFVVLVWSADLFVAGAASIAENLGMSPILIGLTIVSIGTSAPEILVSITAALTGVGEMAIGNAIGSNIANVFLVLGATVLIAPLQIAPGTARGEFPALLLVTAGAALLFLDAALGRGDGLLMLATLVFILWRSSRTSLGNAVAPEGPEDLPHLPLGRAVIYFVAGLGLLIASSRSLVWGASEIAAAFGVSQLVIGLTIVAVGTSLPELAATAAGALRGHTEIAIGNVIGSNLFNLLAVLPMVGLIAPQPLPATLLARDYPVMAVATVMLFGAVYLGRRRDRAHPGHSYLGRSVGLLFTGCYGLYYWWLFAR